jgi:hypothetical protein
MNQPNKEYWLSFFSDLKEFDWTIEITESILYTTTEEISNDMKFQIYIKDEIEPTKSELAEFKWQWKSYCVTLLLPNPDDGLTDALFIGGEISIKPNIEIKNYVTSSNFLDGSEQQLSLVDEFLDYEIEEIVEIINKMKMLKDAMKKSKPTFESIDQKLGNIAHLIYLDNLVSELSHHLNVCVIPKDDKPTPFSILKKV